MSELTRYVTELGEKAKEAETLRQSEKEYKELVGKQHEVIGSFQESRDKLSSIVKQYETVLASRNKDIKEKNKTIDQLSQEVVAAKKESKQATAQVEKVKKLCRALQERLRETKESTHLTTINIDELSDDDLL